MTTIIVTTWTGSTYTLRRADNVPGQPTTIQHQRDAYTPPEALHFRGAAVNVEHGFEFGRYVGETVLLVHGLLRSSPITSIAVNGIPMPICVDRPASRANVHPARPMLEVRS